MNNFDELRDKVLVTLYNGICQNKKTEAKRILKDEVFAVIEESNLENYVSSFRAILRNLKDDTIIFNEAINEFLEER